MSSTKNINFEYLGLIILSFFPLYSFFLVSVAIFIYVIFALISKFTNKKRLRKKNHTIIFLHIVFYLLLIARLFFTENPIEGLKDLQPSLSLIIFPLIWLISNTSLDNKESDTLFKYFTLSSFILGLYILFFSLYFAFTTNQDFTIYYEQVKYFYAHPSYVTLYFLASIIFLFLTFGKRSKRIKIVSILLIGFFIFMIFVFSSRIVVLILFIIGLFELFRRVHISTYKKMMILMFSCLIILASVFLIKPLHKKVKETINPSALVLPQKKFPTSTQIRLGIYNCSYPIIKENWLLGIGGINFEREINICYDKFNNHDKINYVEFPARHLEATKAFFSKTFGWSFQDYGPEYTSFSDAGIAGGFFKSELSAKTENGSALIIMYSNSLEDTYSKVVDAGGSIVKEIFSFPGGRRFHFTEPCGNEFSVWSE